MAITIDKAYVNTFENNVRHLVQQKQSKLTDTVQTVSVKGKDHRWERLGLLEAQKKSGARRATPVSDAEWSTRVSLPNTYDVGTTIEQEDPVQMLIDPQSNLSMAVSSGMKRKQDDIIIAAATGNALDSDGQSHALPPSQIVNERGKEISTEIISGIQTMFMDNHIDVDMQKYAIVPPSAVETIMNMTKGTSNDFVQANALQQYGIVNNWLGFNWMTSTRLLNPTSQTVSCLFYTKQAIGRQVNRDISTRIAEDPTMSFMLRLYAFMTEGAVRVEDEHIIKLDILK